MKLIYFTAFALQLCVLGTSATVDGAIVTGVTIESFSSELTIADGGFDRAAIHVVDGSGLVGNLHTGAPDGTMWDADTFVPPLTSGATDTDPEITFDLGSVLTIGTFEVWNFGTPGFTGRGVNAFELLISTDNLSYTSAGNLMLAEVNVSGNYPGQVIDPTDFTARYVRFDIASNHAGDLTFGVGLAEVQFSTVPEPSTIALSGLTVGLCCCIRRRRSRT